MGSGGHNRILNKELIENFYLCIRKGNYKQTACKKLGITEGAFFKWWKIGKDCTKRLEKGETLTDYEEHCVLLVKKCNQALGEATEQMVCDIVRCEDPKVKLQFLKYTQPKLFSGQYVVDEDTGETQERDPLSIMEERLSQLVDK